MTSVTLAETDSCGDDAAALRLRNFRDLGGLPTRSRDLVVRSQCLYRGSAPTRYDPAALRAFTSLKLRTLIDLRTTVEVSRPGRVMLVADARVVHVPLIESVRPNWIFPSDQSPRAAAMRYFEMLEDSRETMATVVAQIGQAESAPFLVHCAAGRDRTGIVVACLLELLEVTDEAIATDYSHSDEFDRETGRAHAATIVEFLALVRGRFGSVQQMLATSGVTGSAIELLRRGLLVARA